MYSCTCLDGAFRSDEPNCEECKKWCASQSTSMQTCFLNDAQKTTNTVVGVSPGVFFGFLVLSIIFWVLLLWFSIHVLKKCRGKPTWLNGTVIALLVLIFLMGWVPGLGLLLLISLLVLLIVYNNSCKPLKGS